MDSDPSASSSLGQRVFISAGAGGVGTFAIQLAKWLGAEVMTTASSRGEALVRGLGADTVIEYTKMRFEDELRNLDGAFDLLGGESLLRTFSVVRQGGLVVSIAGVPEPETGRKDMDRGAGLAALFWLASLRIRSRAKRHGTRYRYLFMHPSGADLSLLSELVDQGRLRVILDRVLPISEAKEALAYLEAGHAKGKVVLTM